MSFHYSSVPLPEWRNGSKTDSPDGSRPAAITTVGFKSRKSRRLQATVSQSNRRSRGFRRSQTREKVRTDQSRHKHWPGILFASGWLSGVLQRCGPIPIIFGLPPTGLGRPGLLRFSILIRNHILRREPYQILSLQTCIGGYTRCIPSGYIAL